jgi:hypothetical protein
LSRIKWEIGKDLDEKYERTLLKAEIYAEADLVFMGRR